jgi:coenzyme F420-dependent glucose-6-phosphate dehydrogenase
MLKEAIAVIRELWTGQLVNCEGKYFTVENAQVYTLPEKLPPIYIAASGSESATLAGEVGDGLISTAPDNDIVQGFTRAGGKAKPSFGQVTVCWASSMEKATRTALKYWATGAVPGAVKMELALPSQLKAAAELVREVDITKQIVCGPDPKAHLQEIQKYAAAGFDHIYVHQVGPEQEECIRFYEREIFPTLAKIAA